MRPAHEQLVPAAAPSYGPERVVAAPRRPARSPALGRAGRWLADHELLAVVALAPALLAARPAPLAWLAALLVPLLWLAVARRRGAAAGTRFDPPLFWFLALLPLSLLPVTDWSLAFPKLTGLVLGVAVLRAVARAPLSAHWLRRASWIVVAAAAGIALVGLLSTDWFSNKLFELDAFYAALPRLTLQLPRSVAGGIQPNEVAGILVLLTPIAIAASITYSGRHAIRALLLLGTALSLAVLALTQSRMGYLGGLCGLAVLLLGWLVTRRRPAMTALAVLLVLGGPVGVWLVAGRLFAGGAFSGSGTSLDTLPSRLELWDRAIQILQVAPFTGTGPSQFDAVLHGLFVPFVVGPTDWVPHAHNFYLQVMLDQGIPAAVAFFCLVALALRLLLQLGWHGHRTRLLALGCLAGLAGFLVYGLADTIALGARPGFLLWALLGFSGALWRQSSLGQPGEHRADLLGGHARH